jgi:hypothetical protein
MFQISKYSENSNGCETPNMMKHRYIVLIALAVLVLAGASGCIMPDYRQNHYLREYEAGRISLSEYMNYMQGTPGRKKVKLIQPVAPENSPVSTASN